MTTTTTDPRMGPHDATTTTGGVRWATTQSGQIRIALAPVNLHGDCACGPDHTAPGGASLCHYHAHRNVDGWHTWALYKGTHDLVPGCQRSFRTREQAAAF